MAYITYEEYTDTFHGEPIAAEAFERLANDAGVMLDSIVQRPISDEDKAGELFKRAVCYQTEALQRAGGIPKLTADAITGRVTSFSNDGYSESRERVKEAPTMGGMPVSPMAQAVLRQMGYLSRWVYAGRETP
ncbi:MAG: hypothetical protein VB104_07490 [Candidatus Limiplasma sp.]|nr:hypothetical protein [Candidatus Limiplasma sp.]